MMAASAIGRRQRGSGGQVIVRGNVTGAIQVGDNNVQINDNHGSILFDRRPATRRRRPPGPVPRTPVPFVGRTDERAAVKAAIEAGSAVAIWGDEGAGRTALVRQAASDAPRTLQVLSISGFGEAGIRFPPDDLAQQVFDLVWDTEPGEKVNVQIAAAELADLGALVLIDDIALPPSDINRIGDILPGRPMVIATSRSPLADWLIDLPLAPLPRADAIALLRARGGIAVAARTEPILGVICELLDDWPGAIVIAGKAIAV